MFLRKKVVTQNGGLRIAALSLVSWVSVWASVGGRIEGTVTDPTGAIVPGAAGITHDGTGIEQRVTTTQDGSYALPVLPVGLYSIRVTVQGFQPYERTGIAVDANSALVVNVSLVAGTKTEALTVNESAVHVDTASTQMGEVISGHQMTAVPINGRSFTDLLSFLQPGVAPLTSLTSQTLQDVGVSAFPRPAI